MSRQAEYLDFEINIDRAQDGGFIVRASAGGRRAEVRFADPFTADKRTILRQTLTTAALRSSARMRSAATAEVKTMQDFGRSLFDQVIREQVRETYYQVLGQATQQEKGLRLRLALDPSLGDLPWEFLATPQNEFLGLDPHTPIVRYIEQPNPVAPLRGELPLNLLVVIASPKDQVPLNTAAEKARIAGALQSLEAQNFVRVSYLEGRDTWPRLIDTLRPDDTHILHFIGHGAFDESHSEGVLLMEDASGETKMVGSDLLRILVRGKRRLRLVVLNSCLGTAASQGEPFSSVGAGLVRAGVPAVIAMQFEVSDAAARIIAETFYESLALNFPVDYAMTEARREIALLDRDSLEWATPVLFMQVPDGQLFDFTQAAGEAKPTPRAVPPPPAEEVATPSPAPKQPAPKPAGLDLNAKAAERYRAGEEAALRGDWAAAVTGYKGALILVPNYQDAAQKLAYSELQQKLTLFYQQAKQQVEAGEYGRAQGTLAQIRSLDPGWADTDELQTLAEVGQQYQQAVSALWAGDQARGADLLRQVLGVRPDFRDAAKRLEDLAQGGDGLFGERTKAQAPPGQQPESAPVPPQPAGREYELPGGDPRLLAEHLHQWFLAGGYQTQVLEQEGSIIVQGQKSAGLRKWVGMGQAATVILEPTAAGLKASVGGGKWLEQGAAIAVSMVVLWPLLITGGLGMFQQKALMDTLWQQIEQFVTARGGRQIMPESPPEA